MYKKQVCLNISISSCRREEPTRRSINFLFLAGNSAITNMFNARHELKNEWQELHSALDKAQQEIISLDRKLCHARRNVEEEKRKRRMAEQQRDLLVYIVPSFEINKTRKTFTTF